MSTFEVVGLVLGAFSGAIEACRLLREAYRRIQIARRIRIEYTDCEQTLKCQKAAFLGRLRRLLLPLPRDDIQINDLLSDPGGSIWKDRTVADHIESRLGKEKYELVMHHIQKFHYVIEILREILRLDSASLHDYLINRNSSAPYLSREWIDAQIYTVSFCNGGTSRAELFEELEQLNTRLGELLSEIDVETEYERLLTNNPDICGFWVNADTLFKTITLVWDECCKKEHLARLLLQHRTSQDTDFSMFFIKQSPSSWLSQEARITHNRRKIQQQHDTAPVVNRSSNVSFSRDNLISCICTSLRHENSEYCGYLASKNGPYYMYKESQRQGQDLKNMTIDDILRRGAGPTPSRRQRYVLSLVLASSFVQLHETPWLPASWKKSDIVFIADENSGVGFLDQPCLERELVATAPAKGKEYHQMSSLAATGNGKVEKAYRSLELLGIVLLELCFGQLLEEQKFRQAYETPGLTEIQKYAFDAAAARQWSSQVKDEAGPDFNEAVRWCLDGCRITPPEDLRREMLRRVIWPLERCHKYLFERQQV
ncbi:hypothetical protein F4813DRAFT_88770 [Daldinia decipiens]|uniref:uncharacterized protein n=1 Tax=Daldinia decipiens TaxID=326647 RepID=UPI0020C23297|nr:uncharacterized protein F4813DRAFT_88770 [Daldinia decipiens]KAI1657022.1 hypothetical protein F4813DRAFT_88770 [Daldinia decipiens]